MTTSTPSDQFVFVELKYLPDFSEEYSINVRPGLGIAEVGITLTDGWNLTAINQKLDSQFDENLTGAAQLISSIPVPASSSAKDVASQEKYVIPATNVPLEYYEAVIGKDHCGQKQLYGWRYVGFMPYATCPVRATGRASGRMPYNAYLRIGIPERHNDV